MSEEQTGAQHPWQDTSLEPAERARLLVDAMTLEQKANQLGGEMDTINVYTITMEDGAHLRMWRHVAPIEELGIPRFNITNGPVGVGMGDGTPSPAATALPATMGLAATFDRDLAYAYGTLAGSESRTLGQHLIEAPGVCLHRVAVGGRNFEYFSEDPYLSGVMGVEVTKGIQDQGVLAEAKHYVANDEEIDRFRVDTKVDEDVLRELYMLPFEMVVKDADVACIMGSYQRINGTYGCENYWTLTKTLRDDWGFEGYVQSDFWANRSTAASLNAGMDHEMPDHKWYNVENLQYALDERILDMKTIDRALVRRFTQMFKFGLFDTEYPVQEIDAATNGKFARHAAGQVATLLKNDPVDGKPVLPLDKNTDVLIVGLEQTVTKITNCGGGSSQVIPLYEVAPADGMRDVLAELGGDAKVELFGVTADLSNLDAAKEAVKGAASVVVMANLVTTEGLDQETQHLPNRQDEILDALLGVNPKTALVLKCGDPVLMPWLDKATSVIEFYNPGQEDGHAVADVLFGTVNPSAKLPISYPVSADDTAVAGDPSRYPGVDEGSGHPVMRYTERHEMGYRWFQGQGIKPLFPFGFGLSYTTFEISDVAISTDQIDDAPIRVTANVTNTGDVEGAEVVQVYVALPEECQRPPKRLIGFEKVTVSPGETAEVEIVLDPDASSHPFSIWSSDADDFVLPLGDFTLYVGNSSENEAASFALSAE